MTNHTIHAAIDETTDEYGSSAQAPCGAVGSYYSTNPSDVTCRACIDATRVRTAIVRGSGISADRVAAYLPRGYRVVAVSSDAIAIAGTDSAGWTLDDYVIPRLASGCMFATETTNSAPAR